MVQYIIGSKHKTTGDISVSTHPSIHLSLASAKIEADRLAIKHQEKAFIVLEVCSVHQVQSVSVTKTI